MVTVFIAPPSVAAPPLLRLITKGTYSFPTERPHLVNPTVAQVLELPEVKRGTGQLRPTLNVAVLVNAATETGDWIRILASLPPLKQLDLVFTNNALDAYDAYAARPPWPSDLAWDQTVSAETLVVTGYLCPRSVLALTRLGLVSSAATRHVVLRHLGEVHWKFPALESICAYEHSRSESQHSGPNFRIFSNTVKSIISGCSHHRLVGLCIEVCDWNVMSLQLPPKRLSERCVVRLKNIVLDYEGRVAFATMLYLSRAPGLRADGLEVAPGKEIGLRPWNDHLHIGFLQRLDIRQRLDILQQIGAMSERLAVVIVRFPRLDGTSRIAEVSADASRIAEVFVACPRLEAISFQVDGSWWSNHKRNRLYVRRYSGLPPTDVCRALLSTRYGLETTLVTAARRQVYWLAIGTRVCAFDIPVNVLLAIALYVAMGYGTDICRDYSPSTCTFRQGHPACKATLKMLEQARLAPLPMFG